MSEKLPEAAETATQRKRGRKAWEPTPEQREASKFLYAAGATDRQVAYHLGVGEPTIRKHLAREAEFGRELADLGLVGKLYRKAMGSGIEATDGDTACLIFLAKARLGMYDRPPMFGAAPHPNDLQPTRHEELCVQVTYRYSHDAQALAPPPAERLPQQIIEAKAS